MALIVFVSLLARLINEVKITKPCLPTLWLEDIFQYTECVDHIKKIYAMFPSLSAMKYGKLCYFLFAPLLICTESIFDRWCMNLQRAGCAGRKSDTEKTSENLVNFQNKRLQCECPVESMGECPYINIWTYYLSFSQVMPTIT